jgi:hypothetical protein
MIFIGLPLPCLITANTICDRYWCSWSSSQIFYYWNISQMSYYNASPNSDSTKHIGTYQYWNTIILLIMSYWNTIVHCNIFFVLVMCYLYNTKKVHYYNFITNYVYVILEPSWLVLTSPNATSACVLGFHGPISEPWAASTAQNTSWLT